MLNFQFFRKLIDDRYELETLLGDKLSDDSAFRIDSRILHIRGLLVQRNEYEFCESNKSLIKFKHITGGLIRNMRNKNCEWNDVRYQGVVYTIMFRIVIIK